MNHCYKMVLLFFLVLSSSIGSPGDVDKSLSIQYTGDPCSFSIRLSNPSNEALNFMVSFGKGYQPQMGVPAFTRIYVRDESGRMVSGVSGLPDPGYTWLIYRSQVDDLPLSSLAAGESLSATYSLKKLCLGLFEKTLVQKEKIGTYQMKLKTMVYLDKEMKNSIEAETAWVDFPLCLGE